MKKKESQCPMIKCYSCSQEHQNLRFYTCCFRSACQECFDSTHWQKCGNYRLSCQTQYISVGSPDIKRKMTCSRCEQSIKRDIYYCQQCKANFCKDCYDQLHSKEKFLVHNRQKLQSSCGQLFCIKHKKNKTIVTQTNQFFCLQCAKEMKIKKYASVKQGQNQFVTEKITNLTQQMKIRLEDHESKFKDLKRQLDFQFQKLKQIVSEKYASTMLALQNYRKLDKQTICSIRSQLQSKKTELQNFNFADPPSKTINDIFECRMHFVNQQLNKVVKSIKSLEEIEYKIMFPSSQIFQNVFKNITLQKIRLKNDQNQKDGRSLRSSRIMSSKQKGLSQSRRNSQSLSHSQKRLSTINVQKSIRKQVVNQDMKFAPSTSFLRHSKQLCKELRSTPMGVKKINASNSKQNLNNKDCRSDLFASVTVQDQKISQKMNQKIRPNYVKRKSEYLDMRDRLRMPNLMNRFNKAAS